MRALCLPAEIEYESSGKPTLMTIICIIIVCITFFLSSSSPAYNIAMRGCNYSVISSASTFAASICYADRARSFASLISLQSANRSLNSPSPLPAVSRHPERTSLICIAAIDTVSLTEISESVSIVTQRCLLLAAVRWLCRRASCTPPNGGTVLQRRSAWFKSWLWCFECFSTAALLRLSRVEIKAFVGFYGLAKRPHPATLLSSEVCIRSDGGAAITDAADHCALPSFPASELFFSDSNSHIKLVRDNVCTITSCENHIACIPVPYVICFVCYYYPSICRAAAFSNIIRGVHEYKA